MAESCSPAACHCISALLFFTVPGKGTGVSVQLFTTDQQSFRPKGSVNSKLQTIRLVTA